MSDRINQKNHIKMKEKSLQAQANYDTDQDSILPEDRLCLKASTVPDSDGSATVEAALVLPFFLCALCTVCVIAQFLLAEATIFHAVSQTAKVYAKQESLSVLKKDSKSKEYGSALASLGGIISTNVLFRRYIDSKDLDASFVFGGKNGVALTTQKEKDHVQLKASFLLSVPVPFFKSIMIPDTITVRRRMFTGYTIHDAEDDFDHDVVYVTEYGGVYHTSLSCYHICLHISDPKKIEEILKSSHYKKCEKCLKKGSSPSEIYVTQNGDCYHSSLNCSGLKRTVTAVSKSDLSGMRICSECGK